MAKHSEHTIAALFDGIAPRYDFLNTLLSCGQDRRWRDYLVSQIPARKNERLLDVATGTGDVIATCLRKLDTPPHCVGVDISERMLALARKKLRATSAELYRMSAEELQFSDDTFDYVTIAFGLRNVIDKRRALAEFHRVLKPNARLLVLEFFPATDSFWGRVSSVYTHRILPLVASLFSDRKAYRYLPASVREFYRASELLSLLVSCGFELRHEKKFLGGMVRLLVVST